MARPQFMKIDGKTVCVVSATGRVRKSGKKAMKEEIAKRRGNARKSVAVKYAQT